jgi:hypothetical protein
VFEFAEAESGRWNVSCRSFDRRLSGKLDGPVWVVCGRSIQRSKIRSALGAARPDSDGDRGAKPVDVGVIGLRVRGEPVARGRVNSECFPCGRIRPTVTSALRTNSFPWRSGRAAMQGDRVEGRSG